jgi:hypothetical protein
MHHDDAGARVIRGRGQTESRPQIHDRDDPAAQVDDAAHMGGHLGHGRDLGQTDDLAGAQHRDAVVLVADLKREVFAGMFVGAGFREMFSVL